MRLRCVARVLSIISQLNCAQWTNERQLLLCVETARLGVAHSPVGAVRRTSSLRDAVHSSPILVAHVLRGDEQHWRTRRLHSRRQRQNTLHSRLQVSRLFSNLLHSPFSSSSSVSVLRRRASTSSSVRRITEPRLDATS